MADITLAPLLRSWLIHILETEYSVPRTRVQSLQSVTVNLEERTVTIRFKTLNDWIEQERREVLPLEDVVGELLRTMTMEDDER